MPVFSPCFQEHLKVIAVFHPRVDYKAQEIRQYFRILLVLMLIRTSVAMDGMAVMGCRQGAMCSTVAVTPDFGKPDYCCASVCTLHSSI